VTQLIWSLLKTVSSCRVREKAILCRPGELTGRIFKRGFTRFLLVSTLYFVFSTYLAQAASKDPFYPIGLCGARDTNAFPVFQAAGFNLVLGNATQEFLDTAARYQIKVWAGAGRAYGTNVQARAIQKKIRQFDKHPALWAWFLVDEPEMHLIPPAEVLNAHRLYKSAGAKKPTTVVLFKGDAAHDYGDIADITVCDRYPIPWLPVADFGKHLKMARLALGKNKPMVAIVQAFDWSYYPHLLGPGLGPMRPPTYDEIRCMVYLALIERAKGILFYSYDDGPGKWRMPEHPETWDSVCKIVAEINQRLPLFTADHVWWPKRHWFDYTGRRYNAALEASVQSVLLKVKRGNSVVPPGHYILAVNTTDQEQIYSFVPPFERVVKLQVHAENRILVPKNNWLSDTFKPFEVHVYGPMEPGDRRPEDRRRRTQDN